MLYDAQSLAPRPNGCDDAHMNGEGMWPAGSLVTIQTKVSRHLREQVTASGNQDRDHRLRINDWSLADVQHKTEKVCTATVHSSASW